MELDHVVLCVEDVLAAERVLAECGLQFGLHAIHGGQGTANACAFFDNAYLELLSLHDEWEVQSAAVRPLALWERLRWRHTGACPFGVAFRTGEGEVSINTWPYEAAFLPRGKKIPIVTAPNAGHEPLIFLITPGLAIRLREPEAHGGKHRTLTRVAVFGPRIRTDRGREDPRRSGGARDRASSRIQARAGLGWREVRKVA